MKWTLLLAIAITARAQQIDLSALDRLGSKATSAVNVSLDESKLGFASAFLSGDDPDQAMVRGVVSALKAINVRVFEFDKDRAFTLADMDPVRAQLRGQGWSKIVEAREGDEIAEVYMFSKGKEIGGITVIAGERRELSIVNIVGPIDLKTLGSLAGKLGIPKDLMGNANSVVPVKPGTSPKPPSASKSAPQRKPAQQE